MSLPAVESFISGHREALAPFQSEWCWASRTLTLNTPSFEPLLQWGHRSQVPLSLACQALWLPVW